MVCVREYSPEYMETERPMAPAMPGRRRRMQARIVRRTKESHCLDHEDAATILTPLASGCRHGMDIPRKSGDEWAKSLEGPRAPQTTIQALACANKQCTPASYTRRCMQL